MNARTKHMKQKHDIKKLPKWAQKRLTELEDRARRAEATLPWAKPRMQWFTILHPDSRPKHLRGEHRTLFMLDKDSAHPVCSIGAEDCVFVGRGGFPAD